MKKKVSSVNKLNDKFMNMPSTTYNFSKNMI